LRPEPDEFSKQKNDGKIIQIRYIQSKKIPCAQYAPTGQVEGEDQPWPEYIPDGDVRQTA
jgi:hypothetical protein